MIFIIYPQQPVKEVSLESLFLLSKYIVLYFYPKDGTSGCTLEAKTFTDYYSKFIDSDCSVIGVSHDSISSHQKFCIKSELKIPLISDENLELHQDIRFQCWKEKSMYGKKYMGTERSTFVLNGSGEILREWRKVTVPGHVEEVLAFVQDLH